MASAISANRAELLAIANAVAAEKMIDKSIVIEAMEEAIQKSARNRYGAENDIRAKLDPRSGDLRLWRVVEVVEEVEDYFKQVDLKQAEKLQPGSKVGDFIVDPLPPVDLGRIDAQSAKQVIFQKVRDAERDRQYDEFKDRAGEVITGVIKSVEFGHVIVNLGRAEGVIRRDQQIPREVPRVGERVRALILKVERQNRGPQIFLSRAHPEFMKKLFAQEVPEIYDGIIEIKAAARDPGSRAKIGVISRDSSIDPVGACVGMKGSRVQAVVQELQGEKIDIIPWSEDTATFVVNALQPATVSRVVIDEEESRIEVVVPDDQLSLAIGRRGQNVRLASSLTGSAIDIMTEAESSEKRQKEFSERSKTFEEELDVDETLSQLLWPKASASSRKWPTSTSPNWPRSRASTRNWPPSCRTVRRKRSIAARKASARNAAHWVSKTTWPSCRISPRPCWSRWARRASRRSTTWPISRPTNSSPRSATTTSAAATTIAASVISVRSARKTRAAFWANMA